MDEHKRLEFLNQLSQSSGDANMWELGESMGLERQETEAITTTLMADGLLELVSLAGTVRLTDQGQDQGAADNEAGELAAWLDQADKVCHLALNGSAAEDLEIDLETIRSQQKRTQPHPTVMTTCLGAAEHAFNASAHPQAAEMARRAALLRNRFGK